MKNKVVLVGYMGAGKSTVAKNLAKNINFEWLDLDEIIVSREGISINDIFKTKGEIYFRKLEHQIFKDLIVSNNNSFVLSVGGGTPCYANNHEFLKLENVSSIYLQASIKTLYSRLLPSRNERPLISNLNEDEMMDFLAKHLFERSYFYHQAKFVVQTDGKSPEEVVNQIQKMLL
jgi:shikimate kinase